MAVRDSRSLYLRSLPPGAPALCGLRFLTQPGLTAWPCTGTFIVTPAHSRCEVVPVLRNTTPLNIFCTGLWAYISDIYREWITIPSRVLFLTRQRQAPPRIYPDPNSTSQQAFHILLNLTSGRPSKLELIPTAVAFWETARVGRPILIQYICPTGEPTSQSLSRSLKHPLARFEPRSSYTDLHRAIA